MRIASLRRESALQESLKELRDGGIVVAPTETCYGLLADARNPEAVAKVYALKRRSGGKPLSVFFSSEKMASEYVLLNSLARRLLHRHVPGPLTLVVGKRKKSGLARNVSSGPAVGFRISSHPFIRALVRKFGGPLTATSANLSGRGEIYSSSEARKIFRGRGVLLVDGGTIPRRLPSTVVDCTGKKPLVLRQGAIRL